jgi:hypothetical protein
MRAEDQFHVGVVVDDLDAALAELSELFGYRWCSVISVPTPVSLPTGDEVLEFTFAYSASVPRLEVIRAMPGTLWEPAADSGIHHLGYWSDDVAADSAELLRRGFATEATGRRPDGEPYWSFHRSASGPRIELVSRSVQEGLEGYWATGAIAT